MDIEIETCKTVGHEFEACAWNKSLFCSYAVRLFCKKCGKIISTGINQE